MAAAPLKAPSNPYQGRWRWWYSSIADHMIAHPDWRLQDIAAALKKGPATISMIINTDLFREFLANRKREWMLRHDAAIVQKVTRVAEASLDVLLTQIEKKKDIVPLAQIQSIAEGALDRLGYSPAARASPAVQVNVSNGVVVPNVSLAQLEEAREAIRLAESKRAGSSTLELRAEPAAVAGPSNAGEGDDPITLSPE